MIKLIINYSNVNHYIVLFDTMFYSIGQHFKTISIFNKEVKFFSKLALKFK
jgi:hypothetical protein